MYNHRAHHLYTPNLTPRKTLFRSALVKLFPEYLVRSLLFELHMLRVRARSRFSNDTIGGSDLLVNFGSGNKGTRQWVNLDAYSKEGVTRACDLRTSLPIDDNATRGIFCEHFFEHLDYIEDAPRFLAECHRILKPGGRVRIIVPDAERYLRAYVDRDWAAMERIRPLVDGRRDGHYDIEFRTQMELVNMVFRQWEQHKYAYDYETLERLLLDVGFSSVEQMECGQSGDDAICIDNPDRASESLYVEAVK